MYEVRGGSWSRQPSARSFASQLPSVIQTSRARGARARTSWNTSAMQSVRRRQTVACSPSGESVAWKRGSSRVVAPLTGGRYAGGSNANALSAELVGNGERVVEHVERFVELFARDRQRRAAHDD